MEWNENWKVWKDENAFALVFVVPEYAKTVNLPHDILFEQDQKVDSINGGRTGNLDGGVYQYYKKLEIYDSNKLYDLHMNGLGGIAKVYVNESLVDEILYPYMTKTISLSPYLNYDGKDFVLISVHAQDLSSRYYVGGGLTRGVELIERDKCFIQNVFVHTKHLEKNCATILLKVILDNKSEEDEHTSIQIEIENHLKVEEPVTIEKNKEYVFVKEYTVNDIEYWSEKNPKLYTMKVSMNKEVQIIHTGFRTIEYSAKTGLLINGEFTILRGACLHHDQGLLGACTYDDYEMYRVQKLKEGGFNAIRSAHNPASSALLKACDRLGMYVMDEAFDTWAKPKNYNDSSLFFEKEKRNTIQSMVENDYNHPSVIIYSSGNEIGDIHTKKGIETSRELTSYFHDFDSTRPVTCGINGAFSTGNELIKVAADLTGKDASYFSKGDINRFMAIIGTQMDVLVQHKAIEEVLEKLEPTMDILGYNYMTSRYALDSKKYPNRMMVGTETYPKQIGVNYQEIKKYKQVIGDFTWTGFDYLGEVGAYPQLISTAGDISMIGQRRPVSYYRALCYELTTKPCISVRPPESFHVPYEFGPWKLTDSKISYDYKEEDYLQVEVYSVGDTIELYLNDELIGTKDNHEIRPNFTTFDVKYHKGDLMAISYQDKKELGRCILSTPEEVDHIYTRRYTYDSLTFVEIELHDKNDVIVTNAKGKILVEGDVLALSSEGTPYNKGFKNKEVEVVDGVALAICRNGKINVRFENLESM